MSAESLPPPRPELPQRGKTVFTLIAEPGEDEEPVQKIYAASLLKVDDAEGVAKLRLWQSPHEEPKWWQRSNIQRNVPLDDIYTRDRLVERMKGVEGFRSKDLEDHIDDPESEMARIIRERMLGLPLSNEVSDETPDTDAEYVVLRALAGMRFARTHPELDPSLAYAEADYQTDIGDRPVVAGSIGTMALGHMKLPSIYKISLEPWYPDAHVDNRLAYFPVPSIDDSQVKSMWN